MRIIRKIEKWSIYIFSILSIFIIGIVFIFLFRPQFFIDDIELYIERKISTNTSGNFDIGLFEGNFIKGFKMTNVQYHENGEIIFSAGEMYIDPDLSHIFIGDAVLSEVIIHNAYYYQRTKLNILEEGASPRHFKLPELNYEISSLVIDTSIIIYEGQLYKLHGGLKIAYADEITIGFDNLIINSPSFSDNIVIPSGSLSFNSEEIIFGDAKIISDWIDGEINAEINYKDYDKSHGNLIFETISIPLNDSTKFKAKNINLTVKKIDNSSELTMTGKFIFQHFQLDSMYIQGSLKDKDLRIDDAKFEFMNNNIVAKGIINLEKLNWNTSILLNGFTNDELEGVSGNVYIESPFLFEKIKGQLDLANIQIDSLNADSVKGAFRYSKDKLLTADLIILSNGYTGSVKIHPFTDQDNYKMSGNIEFNDFDIPKYNNLIKINNISGNIDFSVHTKNGISKIEFLNESGKGDLLNSTFNTFRGKTSLIVNDNIISGRSDGYLKNYTVGPYNWQKIDYHIKIENSNLLTCDIYLNGELGDTLTIEATTELSDNIYISKLEGSLKQNDIYVEPFFIKWDRERIIVPKIYAEVDAGLITLSGKYEYHRNYVLDGTIENIDLKNIYSIIGKTFQINGKIMESKFHIENNNIYNKDDLLTYLDILIYNGQWDEIGFDSLLLSTSYSDRHLMISKCILQTPTGSLNAEGWFNRGFFSGTPIFTPQDQFNIIMTFDHFALDKFNRYLPWGIESKGFLTGNAKITGLIDDLEILGDIMIKNPSFDRIKGDSLSASITYKKHRLFFHNLNLSTPTGIYSGVGSIPIKLNITKRDTLSIENLPIDFLLTGKTNSIEFIPPYFNVIDSISGLNITDHSFIMSIGITGSLSNPVRNGEFIIDNATVYLNPLEIPVENINGRLKIIDNRLIIDNLTGRLIKKGPAKKFSFTNIFKKDKNITKQNLKIMGSINLDYFFNPDFSIQIDGDDIYLNSSYNLFYGSGFADFYITGRDTVLINGQFHPTPNEFTITSLGDETFYGTEVSNNNLYIYNIHVPFEDGIQLKTDNINVLLDGDVTISKSGSQNFIYSGKINIIDGKFYDNQGNMYEDMSGSIFLSPDENASHLDIHSITSINTSIIDVSILGNPNNPVTHFNDNEGRYNQTELLSMLTFGNAEFSNATDQVENIFSNYFENQIERSISRATSLDEFQLKSTGSLLNVMEGQEDIDIKLIVGKRLSNRMYINTQIDFRNFNENQYEAVYQLSRNTSIVGGLNSKEGNNSLHLKYRIKYYY